MLPADFELRLMEPRDFAAIQEICRRVYPHDTPYTTEELADHHAVFPRGQFVAEHRPTATAVAVHFTLRLRMLDYHVDDSWEVFTDGGTFENHDPVHGMSLYGADLFVSPDFQHQGLGRELTKAAEKLVLDLPLWRMVGASRLPGYGAVASEVSPEQYVADVIAGRRIDPALTVHLKDGWTAVRPIHGYLPHDVESENWAAIIQWINPNHPPPAELMIR